MIPYGKRQRSGPEAVRLVRWLLANGIEIEHMEKGYRYGSTRFDKGSYVVWMDQAHRGLADTALGPGVDVSSRISVLYAPPGAWSHGYLWGADVVRIPDDAVFTPDTEGTDTARLRPGAVDGWRGAAAFAMPVELRDRRPRAERPPQRRPDGSARHCAVHDCARPNHAGRKRPLPGQREEPARNRG